jgi:uncharacterized membrane-anchored protein
MGQQKPGPAQQPSTQNDVWTQIEKLDWNLGPTQGGIAGVATVTVPKGSAFLGSDEKIDPDALLEILKKNNVEGNEERKRRGLETLVLEDWYVVPHYDVQTKRLEWGTKLRHPSGGVTVNYSIRLLGRAGVMSAVLVSDPASLDKDIKSFKAALAGFDFIQGQKYSEFRSGDKVAEYGLAALIVGGAAAVAVKSGAFKALGKFLIFGVFGGLAAAWAAIRGFVSRRRA